MTWSTVARPRRRLGAALAVVLALTALPSLVGSASATADVTFIDGAGENCNGVVTTPGSENTRKTVVGGDLQPGGTVEFRVSYPQQDLDDGDMFVLTDCFVVRDGDVLDQFEIRFVPNENDFDFEYSLDIPADLPLGTELCNFIKTTEGPSAAQGSNRKAGVCFNVGGSLNVQKVDAVTGEPVTGAKFEVACEDDPLLDPDAVIGGLEDANGAPVEGNPVTGWLNSADGIAVYGEEGAECTVTELAAPDGYVLPPLAADRTHTYVIPRQSDDSVVVEIENEPVPPTYAGITVATTPAGSYSVPTSWELAKTVNDAGHSGVAGQSAGSSTWTVTATKTVGAPTGFALTPASAAAVLTNSNPIPVVGTVTATVGGVTAAVDCNPAVAGDQTTATIPSSGTSSCTYSGTPTAVGDRVVVTFTSATPFVAGGSDDEAVVWTVSSTGVQTITVDDAREVGTAFPASSSSTQSWQFTETFSCPSDTTLYAGGTLTQTVVNTATSNATADATASVQLQCSLPGALTVSASPAGQYDVATTWALTKSVDDDAHEGVAGGTAGTSEWTVAATRTDAAPSAYRLSAGSVEVRNPNGFPVTVDVDATLGGAVLTLDCDAVTAGDQTDGVVVPAAGGSRPGALVCSYPQTATTSGAQLAWAVTSSTEPVTGPSSSAPVVFTENRTGPQTLAVDDDRAPAGVLPDTATQTEEWSYEETFTCPTEAAGDDVDGVAVQQVVNTATAPGLPDASATVTVTCTLPPVAGLTVVKSVQSSDAVVNPGDTLTYTLVVTAKEATERDVVVTDVVPGRDPAEPGSGDTTYVPGSAACEAPGPCTPSYDATTGTVSWAIGDLAPGASRRVSFAVTIDTAAGGQAVPDVVNRGVARSDETPSTPSNRVVTPVTAVLSARPTPPPTPTPTPAPVVLPFVDTPRTLPFTGIEVLPVLAFGTLTALLGALLVGTARRREQE